MRKDNYGIEINLEKGQKIVEIPTSPELKEHLKKKFDKNHTYYLTEFIGGDSNYSIAHKAFQEAMEKSLPKNIKDSCKYCNGKGKDVSDKACNKYYLQMQLTFTVASTEFINIIFKNTYIYNDKRQLQKLTIEFFNCLRFIEGEGKMYFLLDRMCRYILNSGFLTLSQMFANSETLQTYRVINKTLDDIHDKSLENKTLQRIDEDYLELQREFFEGKLRYYKEKIFIEEKEQPKKLKENKEVNTTSIPQYALYYYYLQESGDFGYFENHPEGKVKAITELIQKENLNTSTKYFQKVYNKIAHYNTNRVAKNQVSNIDFVVNNMLKGYPKAKKIASEELKEAKTKYR